MRRILIVANRLPIKISKNGKGYEVQASEGGLATGLASLSEELQTEWIGWPGLPTRDSFEEKRIEEKLGSNYHPVFMNQREVKNFYQGFSNETIWPLFHCFTECAVYEKKYWDYYKRINNRFCEKVLEVAKADDIIWVQDYHLMLLPGMLKDRLKNNPVGFFLHIPFPSYELFRTLPWREDILQGLMGADLIGFHTYEYMRHFYSSVYRILGYDCSLGEIKTPEKVTHIDSFPMGINFEKFHSSRQDEQVINQIQRFKGKFGKFKLILSVDRLDYTKGILHRLKAFDELLEKYPGLREKVSLIMITVPSRFSVPQYKNLKENIDETVGKINGKYSTLEWTPIHYFYRSIPFDHLTALYNMCDIGLVTPLRDGMNLVAKEYIASKQDYKGVLILSEMAGSAIELEEALKVNPNNQEDIVNALYKAVNMPEEEQARRIKKMQKVLKIHTVEKWARNFIKQLNDIYSKRQERAGNIINGYETRQITEAFASAHNPLVILDYDGTLVAFNEDPSKARPSRDILNVLKELSTKANVILISGRDHNSLEEWFGNGEADLIAEHGMWFKKDGEWHREREIDTNWKEEVLTILENFTEKTPGSFVENKSHSLAFHYRKTDNFLAEMRIPQLTDLLSTVCARNQLEILKGNKVLEIRVTGINKGTAVVKLLNQLERDFIVAIGDDKTDEDMFAVMPEHAFTIKVGDDETIARYRVENIQKVKSLLQKLAEASSDRKSSNANKRVLQVNDELKGE